MEKLPGTKKAVDEYLINFIYTGEEVYNYIQEQLEKAKENAITGDIEVESRNNNLQHGTKQN